MTVAEDIGLVEAWLLLKPRVRLVGAQCVQRRTQAEVGGMEGYRPTPGEFMRCGRPVWGDGKGTENGFGEGLCSRCFHEHMAFHGSYTMLQANPAAAKLDATGISRLTFGPTLPEVGAHYPDTFPSDWTNPR
jgi:hypothetical protein